MCGILLLCTQWRNCFPNQGRCSYSSSYLIFTCPNSITVVFKSNFMFYRAYIRVYSIVIKIKIPFSQAPFGFCEKLQRVFPLAAPGQVIIYTLKIIAELEAGYLLMVARMELRKFRVIAVEYFKLYFKAPPPFFFFKNCSRVWGSQKHNFLFLHQMQITDQAQFTRPAEYRTEQMHSAMLYALCKKTWSKLQCNCD